MLNLTAPRSLGPIQALLVFDILLELDPYDLPGMQAMKAMMSAVAKFGDFSKYGKDSKFHFKLLISVGWDNSGLHVLQEIQ